MNQFNGPVIMNIGAAGCWFKKGLLESWKERILFMYGTDLSDYSFQQGTAVGIPYYHFPFGSDPQIMRPLSIDKLYDVTFVANADSGLGRRKFIAPLIDEMVSFRNAAHRRAMHEHTWLKRAEYFLEKINSHLSKRNIKQQSTPKLWNKICRYRDMV